MDRIELNRNNFNTDWRAMKPNYLEQMEHFYMSEEFADIQFIFKHQNAFVVFLFPMLLMYYQFSDSRTQICACCGLGIFSEGTYLFRRWR